MSAKRLSLVDFGKTQKGSGTHCWLCSIPEREEVEQAIASGRVTKAAATRWLRDVCGYEEASSVARVGNHMDRHVKRPA